MPPNVLPGSYFVWGGIILIRQARSLKRVKPNQRRQMDNPLRLDDVAQADIRAVMNKEF